MAAPHVLLAGWRPNPASSVPPYEQLRVRILDLAAAGKLPAGTKFPSVRALAAHLSLATNTVARTYRELEQAGAVSTGGRAGTVMTATGDQLLAETATAAAEYAAVVRRNGMEMATALDLVRAAVERSAGS
ncbi:GntR family transcriptional regulator [Paenarthrobacter sp. Z7-10]|nr:GntR family transcriptional regulator [Paenarthrobacter sp. Z7-10]